MHRPIAARIQRVTFAVALVALFPSTSAFAQYEASASYYAGISGTGTTLKAQLKTLMTTNRTYTSYAQAGDYLALTDAVPGDRSKMYLVYDRTVVNKGSVTALGFTGNGADDYGSREHVWPDSRQNVANADGDIHMLKPSVSSSVSSSPNAQRGNYFYGGATMTGAATRIGTSGSNYQFFAGDYDKGDVARIVFYGATTYGPTLSLVNGTNASTGNQSMGDLNTMLHWHYLDTPDTFELRRNDVIAKGDDAATAGDDYSWSGNNARNAYIDRPEYVWSVYADQANDTKLTLAGGTVNADGSSAQTVNLGRVLKGAAVPAGQKITLSKKGVDGTYYSVTIGGAATSSVTGRYNAFAMDSDATKEITVGLSTTTATAGLKTGTVTIDNLDVTMQGGAGAGANDGNDVATIHLSVLDSSNSSFSSTEDQNARLIDFGTVGQNTAVGSESFTVYDLASTLGSALTAMLDLNSVSASGDASKFGTTLANFTNLAADGVGKTFNASFDTSTLGVYTATYTLNFSDENLAGTRTQSTLFLTLTGTVVAVPEPTTLAAVACVMVTFARRRRIF